MGMVLAPEAQCLVQQGYLDVLIICFFSDYDGY